MSAHALKSRVCMVSAQLGPRLVTRVCAEGIEGEESNSGATATVALVRRDKIVVANVGDSRAVVCRRCMPQLSETRVLFIVPTCGLLMRVLHGCFKQPSWLLSSPRAHCAQGLCPGSTIGAEGVVPREQHGCSYTS